MLLSNWSGKKSSVLMSVNRMRCRLSIHLNIRISRIHSGHSPSKNTSTCHSVDWFDTMHSFCKEMELAVSVTSLHHITQKYRNASNPAPHGTGKTALPPQNHHQQPTNAESEAGDRQSHDEHQERCYQEHRSMSDSCAPDSEIADSEIADSEIADSEIADSGATDSGTADK